LLFSVAVEQCNNIALPRTRSFKTVLRSPHIDKRSREQFEKIEHRSLMLLPSYLADLASVVNYVVPTFGIQVTQHMTLKR
jgi:ribosomal protein S10